MRVPIEWLKEFVEFSLSPEELALKLTMIGLEVESLEKAYDDTVLEVNVTPNRPDCLSILGIAREVSAMINSPLRFPECGIQAESGPSSVAVVIADEDLCLRYAGRDIEDVAIGPSPEWMKRRLEQCGMRPINNIVDITNYVLMEMGHPLHAFDKEKLKGGRIRVARAIPGSRVTTLDGSVRDIPDGSLLIWDAERPVAVAGVMGGAESEVEEHTKQIFLESAYFLPASVRRTSKALGLKTESAYRFERGTDIEFLEKALDRAAFLMATLAGGRVSKKVDVYPKPFEPPKITVRFERVNKILGTSIIPDDMLDIMKRLGIEVLQADTKAFTITPPSYRRDMEREIDVVEEVARFHGYEKIPVTVPKIHTSGGGTDRRHEHTSTVKTALVVEGFTEAVNYSFMNYQALDMLSLGSDDPRRRTLTLRNPLNEDESCLRTTLVPSLVKNLVVNVSTGSRDVRLFEISRVYIDQGESLPKEEHHLGVLYFKEKGPSLWKDETPDFFLVKGVVESLMRGLRIQGYTFEPSTEPFLHPGKSCDIKVSGVRIGFLGLLHPQIVEKLGLKVSRKDIVLLEIDLDLLFNFVPKTATYTPIPKYPGIERDVALIVDESLPAFTIIAEIRAYPSELMEDVVLFDFYKGKNIPEGKKSLAFTVRYRAKDRTLTDSEIEELHAGLVTYVTTRTGGVVRGA
ncbi:MAG TPA: phenylalanine--tRNA ligase subunit beta [Thermodesulfovibrionales bacterium]|nr:phenylalanine--tRNA ligase subunit beta [Thermodesulfovibrionales bacterium]